MRVCLLHCVRVRLHNGFTRASGANNATYAHAQGRVEAKKLLSSQGQSDYTGESVAAHQEFLKLKAYYSHAKILS